jgi:Tfp pilus assembly PilM family ATPase
VISSKSRTKPGSPAKAKDMLAGSRRGNAAMSIVPAKHYRWGREVVFVIEETGVQMAAVSWYGQKHRLIDARKVYVSTKAEHAHKRETFIGQAIAEYVQKYGGSRPKAILAISGLQTVFRTFTLPPMTQKQLDAAVKFESRKQIPFPVNDCQYDYRPVARVALEDGLRLKIALHAATKAYLQELLSPFEQMEIDVDRIYLTHDVLGQLLRSLPEYSPDQHFTLLNIERSRSELAYYRGTELQFAHVCSLGSSFIADRTDPTVFEYFAESLAGEIQNSLDYYTGQVSSQYANRIYIYGDLAYTDELITLMSDNFGFSFRRFPVGELEIDRRMPNSAHGSLTVCLPAVAAASCGVALADLLPQEKKQAHRTRRIDRYTLMGLFLLAVTLGAIWMAFVQNRVVLQRSLDGLSAQISEFKSSRLFDTYNTLKQQIALNQAYLEKAKARPSRFGLLLKEISILTPQNVRLDHFNFNPEESEQNVQIQGVVTSSTVPPEVILAEYAENLKSSPLFQNVTVVRYTKRITKDGFDLEFELSAKGAR